MKKIAIIGGLGYAGLHLVKYMEPLGYDITVYSRKKNNVLLDEGNHIHIRQLTDAHATEKFDAVINLAYPSSYSRKRNFNANREIVALIKKISGENTIIIHTSTIAVFGAGLDYPINRGRVAFRRDHHYTEVKIHIENLLQKELKNNCLHIVRLGNVWGPGSQGWLNQVVDRIVFNVPFPESARKAPSNMTYIFNICDFINNLISNYDLKSGAHFHHFAEFGAITWGEILDRLGRFLGEKPVYMAFQVFYPLSFIEETMLILAPLAPKAIFYKMLDMRRLSSFAKSIVDIVPVKYRRAWKSHSAARIFSRDTKDIVFSNFVLFKHSIGFAWTPQYSFEEALTEVRDSLAASGYIIKDESSRSGKGSPEQTL